MRDSEKPHRYEYFLLGYVTPVRVAFDSAGLIMGAEVPDVASPSGFKWANTYLDRLNKGEEVEAIDHQTFDEKVREYTRSQRKPIVAP